MHYYKRNLGDYAKKAGRLTMLQHGAYTLLIDACYDREHFPTREEAIDWTWASSTAEIEAVDFVLRKFFELEDGRYVQRRIQQELVEYHQKADTNSRIAKEREANRKKNSTNRPPVVHESPPNQEPLTNNQEPLTNNQEKDKAANTNESISRDRSSPPDRPVPRTVQLATLLRKHGAAVTHANPPLMEWAERGVTDDQALLALDLARRRREEAGSLQPVNAGFLDSILRGEVLKPKTEKPSRHHGIAETDFREGVTEDGRF